MRREWQCIRRLIARLHRAEEGVAATEYAVLLALIILGSVGVIGTVGSRIAGIYVVIKAALPAGIG